MREIGGYLELDTYTGNMRYNQGIKLNCGRNALDYLIKAKNITDIMMPKFMCDSCDNILKKNDIKVRYYSLEENFKPKDILRKKGEWLYAVNYYGQLENEYIESLDGNIILDNAQAYFQEPVNGINTIYTCRKFFGVPDGAILFTDKYIEGLAQDESYNRMHFLLGRFEKPASDFYSEYVDNNTRFSNEPLKRMSKLTENLLHGIDYDLVLAKRTKNFEFLDKKLSKQNKLNLRIPQGAFMYPLYIDNGNEVRKLLQRKRIYIPILWPAVFKKCLNTELEFDMAMNILPLPVDQRYDIEDMYYLVSEVLECIN